MNQRLTTLLLVAFTVLSASGEQKLPQTKLDTTLANARLCAGWWRALVMPGERAVNPPF